MCRSLYFWYEEWQSERVLACRPTTGILQKILLSKYLEPSSDGGTHQIPVLPNPVMPDMSREQSDHEFLTVLQRLSPATVQGLCEAIGVTPNAVRQKLLRYQAEGLIERRLVRQERGRPLHTYHLTHQGLKEIGDDHAEIAVILWRQIMGIRDPQVRQSVLNGVKQALVERFGECVNGNSLASRLQTLTSRMAEQGFELEYKDASDDSPLPILTEHNCPYHELAAEDPSICELEQSVFSELLGVPVELSSCRLDGHQCCEFQVG